MSLIGLDGTFLACTSSKILSCKSVIKSRSLSVVKESQTLVKVS